jgi:hypothetical protein
LGTSRLHQRHRLRPLAPFGRVFRSAHPPGMVRVVLMDRLCILARGSCQTAVLIKFFLTLFGPLIRNKSTLVDI